MIVENISRVDKKHDDALSRLASSGVNLLATQCSSGDGAKEPAFMGDEGSHEVEAKLVGIQPVLEVYQDKRPDEQRDVPPRELVEPTSPNQRGEDTNMRGGLGITAFHG